MNRQADYLGRIERALALIEGAAGSECWPGVPDLARAAAMSEYHFHRVYRLMTGETPQQTLSRARLGGSLPALAGRGGIADGAAHSAYATNQSYARALKALTGATPSQLRADPDRFAAAVAALSVPGAGDPPMAPAPVEIAIVELAPLRLVARRNVGAYEALNGGFARLFEELMEQVGPEQVTGLYGIPHDDPRSCPPDQCRFDCAVSVDGDVAPRGGLALADIAAGPQLRLTMAGDYDRIHGALDHLYQIAIALDMPLADALPLNHYHHDPDVVAEADLRADVYLALA